jgi:DNA-binding IclR family transcriptional regulator
MQILREEDVASGRDASGPRSLTRLLGLFDALAHAGDGMTLAELNVALDSPKSSLLNLLRPLVSEGYLVHEGNSYRLGPAIFRLASGVLSAWPLPRLVKPFMDELSARTEETVLLAVCSRAAGVMTYVDIIDSPNPVRYQIPVGTTRPLYASAAGRLLLAWADAAWRDAYLASVVFRARTASPMNRASLRRELARIRADGFSLSIDAYSKGLSAIAAPVFDAQGQCVASLNIAGPSERFRSELDILMAAVKDVAANASRAVPAGLFDSGGF